MSGHWVGEAERTTAKSRGRYAGTCKKEEKGQANSAPARRLR
jgi:hypothetical protein